MKKLFGLALVTASLCLRAAEPAPTCLPMVFSVDPPSGPSAGSTPVLIMGGCLWSATDVFFGANRAIQVWSDESGAFVSCVTPPGGGVVHVTVATPTGTSDECMSDLFTYQQCDVACAAEVAAQAIPGVPAAFRASVADGPCGNDAAFLWTFGDGSTSTEQNPAHAFALAGSYSWSLTATNGGGACQKYGIIAVYDLPSITSVEILKSPFRLRIRGNGFRPGCSVLIGGKPVPQTAFESPEAVVARKGAQLKALLPRGVTVGITVVNPGEEGSSQPFPFQR